MWIVDPCDGTVNFISGVPFFAVSIALMFKSEIIIGVVYDPVRDEMFVARKDEGAFLNGQRIQVGTRRTLRYSTLGIDFAHRTSQIRQEIRIVERLAGEVQVVRSFYSGALELCYVSTGRIDIRIDDSYKLWDVAAGSLIAREAGARVTDLDGMHWGPRCLSIVAANQALHRQIMHKLRSQR
jgi:myo-inositol-1(or 4)-monophosphatase